MWKKIRNLFKSDKKSFKYVVFSIDDQYNIVHIMGIYNKYENAFDACERLKKLDKLNKSVSYPSKEEFDYQCTRIKD